MVGKRYEARKKSVGNHAERGLKGQYLSAQNGHKGCNKKTDEIIADELGISHNQVRRAEHYAHGIDAIRETDPETADAILKGETDAVCNCQSSNTRYCVKTDCILNIL